MTRRNFKAVLLDRDGVLNVKAPEGDYIRRPEDLSLLPGAGEAVARLNRAGLRVFVVTNQRGLARGLMTEADLEAVHARLADLLAAHDARLDDIHVCPHDTGACTCRKPAPGLLQRAMKTAGLAPSDCVMIGDSRSDMQAAHAAGVFGIFLKTTPADPPLGDHTAISLPEAVAWLLASLRRART